MNRNEITYTFAHVGLNCTNVDEAYKTAQLLRVLFNCTLKEGNTSIFANKEIEVMKKPFLGKNGHIAFFTNDLDGAMCELNNNSIDFRMETLKVDENGRKLNVYLSDEIGGFAIHILQII